MILDILEVTLRVALVIILVLIFLTLVKIEKHQAFVEAYLSESEITIINQ